MINIETTIPEQPAIPAQNEIRNDDIDNMIEKTGDEGARAVLKYIKNRDQIAVQKLYSTFAKWAGALTTGGGVAWKIADLSIKYNFDTEQQVIAFLMGPIVIGIVCLTGAVGADLFEKVTEKLLHPLITKEAEAEARKYLNNMQAEMEAQSNDQ